MMDVEVSILCMAYNHGKYIRQTLESMVSQKTDFPFEILINDDASTDNTAEIIREYSEKYPDIVKPIFQKENQYSKGINIQNTFNIPRAQGKYLAYCEGDDYWTDEYKLQKQVDFMKKHPDCTLCIHNAVRVDTNGNVIGDFSKIKYDGEVSCEQVIAGGGGFCATNSIMAPAELLKNRPDYFDIMSYDFVIQMYLASCGKTYCMPETMSAYRVAVENSWTSRMKKNPEKYKEHILKTETVRRAFDECTGFKYHDVIESVIVKNRYNILYQEGNYKALLKEPYKNCKEAQNKSWRVKTKIFIGARFPFLLKLFRM